MQRRRPAPRRAGFAHTTLALVGAALVLLIALAEAGDEQKKEKGAAWKKKAYTANLTEEQKAEVSDLFELVMARSVKCAEKTVQCAEKTTAQCEGAETSEQERKAAAAEVAKNEKKKTKKPLAPEEKLALYLAKSPAAWDVVEPLAMAVVRDERAPAAQRARVVDLAAWTPGPRALAMAGNVWELSPESFGLDHYLAFAPYGCERSKKELLTRAQSPDPGDVRPAAFFALHGKGVGRARLVAASTGCCSTSAGVRDTWIAAAALEGLGESARAGEARRRVHDMVLALLDAGELARARETALQLEFLQELLAYGKAASLAFLDMHMADHCAARADEVVEADQVFEVVERVMPH